MVNLYHIIYKVPSFEAYSMEIEYENLVQKIYKSGLVRIDADQEKNFIKYTDLILKDSLFFSDRELNQANLIENTKLTISKAYSLKFTEKSLLAHTEMVFSRMKNMLTNNVQISEEKQLKLIRLLVQSTQPIVLLWILIEKVQIFISYGHSIGDVMDIKNWKISGSNSGMQSTDGKSTCVFVSCGGDPFKKEYNPFYGDGWPAVARLQIIAAQELGHYSDIIRDYNGRQTSRHSANFSCTRAKHNVLIGRRGDVKNCLSIKTRLLENGLARLIELDKNSKFYQVNKVNGVRVIINSIKRYIYKRSFLYKCDKLGYLFVRLYQNDKYMGMILDALINDMSFNLAPIADVYQKDDKEEEEAIACIEALARVPQQVIKWGHIATSTLMKDLYKIYYKEVIPDLINKYEILTGHQYKRDVTKPRLSLFRRFNIFFAKNQKLPSREI